MIASLLALALAQPACAPLPGVEAVLATPARWIVVGEMHGTAEAPAAYADLVCHASAERPVVAAIEQFESDQPLIDAWMASDGDARAKAALFKARLWTTGDGRSSEAYFRLLDTLRLMVCSGRVSRVVAFQPVLAAPPGPGDYEAAMADRLRAASTGPSVRVVVLVGNVHAMLKPVTWGAAPYMHAAGLLHGDATLTLNIVSNGGAAWNCDPQGCGVHPFRGAPLSLPRGIVLGGDGTWSGAFNLGVPATASPPARVTP